jgi:hypothetical protein
MDRLPTEDPTEGNARVIDLMTLDKPLFDDVVEDIAADYFPKPAGEDIEKTKDRLLDILERNPKIRIHYKDNGDIDRVELNVRGGSRLNKKTRRSKGRRRHSVRRKLRNLSSRRR